MVVTIVTERIREQTLMKYNFMLFNTNTNI